MQRQKKHDNFGEDNTRTKKEHSGTIVIEYQHSGIPNKKLKSETFDDYQLAVLAELKPELQEKIRQVYPFP